MRTDRDIAIQNIQFFSADLNQLIIELDLVLCHIDDMEFETDPSIYKSIDLEWSKAKKVRVLADLEKAIAGVNEQFKLLKEELTNIKQR